MTAIIKLPWRQQPQGAVVLRDGPCFAWSGATPGIELVSGAAVTVNNTTRTTGPYGVSAACAVSQQNIEWSKPFITTSDGAGTGDFTVIVVANPTTGGGSFEHVFAQKNDAAGPPYGQLNLLANCDASTSYSSGSLAVLTYGNSSVSCAAAGAVDGNTHVYLIRRLGGVVELWSDGLLLAQQSGTVTNIINPTNRYTAIGSAGNATTYAYKSSVLTVGAYNRALSAAECYALRSPEDVFDLLFAPRKIIIPVSSGGGAASHPATGALSADAATVSGTATHKTLHTSTGALSADAATVSGTATHKTLHTTTGALSAGSATVAGTATHPHTTTGALTADAATISGTATHTTVGSHAASGALAADAAAVSGTATHKTLHTTTGALSADAATVAGTAAHLTLHTTTGALSADAATIAGDAVHSGLVTHTTDGTLTAGYATVSGSAQRNGVFVDATNIGAPGRPRRSNQWVVYIDGKRYIGTEQEITQLISEIAEEQAEEVVTEAKPAKKPRIIVKPGKAAKTEKPAQVAEAKSEATQIQAQVRNLYAEAYAKALFEYELQEEEDLIGIL